MERNGNDDFVVVGAQQMSPASDNTTPLPSGTASGSPAVASFSEGVIAEGSTVISDNKSVTTEDGGNLEVRDLREQQPLAAEPTEDLTWLLKGYSARHQRYDDEIIAYVPLPRQDAKEAKDLIAAIERYFMSSVGRQAPASHQACGTAFVIFLKAVVAAQIPLGPLAAHHALAGGAWQWGQDGQRAPQFATLNQALRCPRDGITGIGRLLNMLAIPVSTAIAVSSHAVSASLRAISPIQHNTQLLLDYLDGCKEQVLDGDSILRHPVLPDGVVPFWNLRGLMHQKRLDYTRIALIAEILTDPVDSDTPNMTVRL